ncbi:hypothetical protein SPRG_01773 [Saprolegnia parasitica CBS 223.65]|uniref:Purple acid phosphatase n=1 Tax=Saprolegnia parasitica (strain CBS 223.65) TaxID=695850 RepID=A0A067CTQ6_SAPPC|nr:hypothetical protein SPRG_01773 [Saprolegnia parasitica CBS 223.65]KDO33893.1 hypothetical protein SPRG_01773 [Saprolegnia parasitica CBS 223.65]|eukprot:XP_012195529.1 hypothetical protein SPRG_01773 [Saprolegnia parasitica CBS 223.65]
MRLAAFALLCVTSALTSNEFHLSLVGDGSGDYMLDWVTAADATASTIYYGSASSSLTQKAVGVAAGSVAESSDLNVACWTARLSGIKAGATVYYDLASAGSSAKSFTATPANAMTWAVFGDMGATVLGKASGITLPALKSGLSANAFHGILNIGDLGYELVGSNGAAYMQQLEPLTSAVPMHTTIGNHEMQYAAQGAMQNYVNRFKGLLVGAGEASGSGSNTFYSFNAGYVHFVFLNTEVYGDEAFMAPTQDGNKWVPNDAARVQMQTDQKSWLEFDLSRVKREVTPFVVVCGHRPPNHIPTSASTGTNKFAKDLVPLFDKYAVDLMLTGHEHAYYNIKPSKIGSYNFPPWIISGAAGNNEFIRPTAKVELDTSVFTVVTNINNYGYGYLTATAEKLSWVWGQAATDSPGGMASQPAPWAQMDKAEFLKKTLTNPTPVGKPLVVPAPNATMPVGNATSTPSSSSPATKDGSKATASSAVTLMLSACTVALMAMASV